MKIALLRISVLLLAITGLVSCTESIEDRLSTNEIVGTWYKTESLVNSYYVESLEYAFNVDNTVVVSRIILENNSSKVVGFRYKASGTYQVIGTELNLQLFEILEHDDTIGPFSSVDELIPTGQTRTESLSITISQDKNKLTFNYPPCSDAENCIDSQTFKKKR